MKLRNLFTIVLMILLSSELSLGWQLDVSKFKDMKARSIGPAGMSGRITAIDVVASDPKIIYAGSASGGLWKSSSGGIAWEPVFDKEAVSSIGAITIQQNNPDVIWVGTGEGNPRNSLNGGYGLYKSLDAGKTWTLMGLEKTRNIHRIIIHRDNPDVVFVASIGSPWGDHPERGVFKTKDGGKTWEKVLYVDQKTGAADMVVDPTNPNKILVAMWEHRRKPWTFTSGGPSSGLYVTLDGGTTWTKQSTENGLPEGDLGRIGLAIADSKPNIVYAIVEAKKNALYRSEDGGYKWSKVNDEPVIGNRPFYYNDIFVDSRNENRLYHLYSSVDVSEDGGKTWSRLMQGNIGGIHPDHHAWYIHPENPGFMIDGNDGGLNITHDGGKTWRFAENLPVGQFYHVNVDNQLPYYVYGGMQDNGSWGGPAYVWKSGGIRNSYWQEVSFGDGFDVVPDPENPRYGYTMSQQGNVRRYDIQSGHTKVIKPTHPDPGVQLRFNWNSAIAQDPFDKSTIYFGSQFVHKSTNKGSSWEIISPDLTTNEPEKQKQHESGGLTMDATGAENYTTVLAIEPSAVEKGVIWVGTDDGNVQLTRDGGKSWINVAGRITSMPKGAWVCQVKASNFSGGEAYVVANNYRNFDFKPYLFRTKDYGQTWESLVSENTVWGFSLSVVQDPVEKRLVFLGTEYGLYVSIDEGKTWSKWTNGYPTVPTMDLVIQPREHDLVIGTFGRSFYVLDDILPLREIASKGTQLLDHTVKLFPIPEAYMTVSQTPSGLRFTADAMFSGQNRDNGARISYVFNKPGSNESPVASSNQSTRERRGNNNATTNLTPESPKADNKKADSLIFEFFNEGGKLVRTIKRKAPEENGVYIYNWNLREEGPEFPGRGERRGGFGPPSGVDVLPGNYKVRLTLGDTKDSATVKVNFDPRLEVTESELKAIYDAQKELDSYIALASEVTSRLKESISLVDDYSRRMRSEDAIKFKQQLDLCKTTRESLNGFMDAMVGKVDNRQGITRNPEPTVTGYIFTARGYLRSTLDAPGETEKRTMEHANTKLMELVNKVNSYYDTEWSVFRSEIEKVEFSPFTDLEPLKKK